MDVKDAQKWLNEQFDGSAGWVHIDEDGVAGYNTMVGFVRALQILLRIDVDGGFGNETKQSYNNLFGDGLSEINNADNNFTVKMIISLVNLALLCRIEVSNTDDISVFSEATRQGIISTMAQLGIDNYIGGLRAREIKALFTSDAYYLISNGDATTREIQQAINRKYNDILDNYIATNGLYDRNMNTALIKMIQYEIGTNVDGGWGEGTMSSLPVLGPGSTRTNLVYILQYLLYLNGFDPNGFDGGFGNGVTNALKQFQELMKLDVDGYCGRQAWSALVVSCGDTTRSANACDTCFEITPTVAQKLLNGGYEVVGRYLTGYIDAIRPKALQPGEAKNILNSGLKLFVIYQDNNRQISDFTFDKGIIAAVEASNAAKEKGIPKDSIIYFAVDMDVYEDQIDSNIKDFFRGINHSIDTNYKVGIYGPRKVCSRISELGYSVSSFVADMSYGYSCNVGAKMPNDWCYDQFKEISRYINDFGIDIDKVNYRGNVETISNLEEEEINKREILCSIIQELYTITEDYSITNKKNWSVKEINKNIVDYLRNVESYTGSLWDIAAGEMDDNYISYMESDSTIFTKRVDIRVPSKYGDMEIPHMAATLSAQLQWFFLNKEIDDLTGWAGDLLQLGGKIEEIKGNHLCSENDVYKLIGGIDDEFAKSIGFDNITVAGFNWEDLESDIDAVVISKALKNGVRIDQAFSDYYLGQQYKTRIKTFIQEIEGEVEVSENKIKEVAKSYTDLNSLTSKMFADHFGNYDSEEFSDKLSGQFAKKMIEMYNNELEALKES